MNERVDLTELDEADVVRFLKQHPDFFEHHPNLLKRLHLKHESGEAISLIERQNQILRKENRELIDRLNDFIQVAQRNDRLFLKLQSLIIELLGCRSLNALATCLHDHLLQHFDVDEVQLVLSHRLATDGDLWLYCDFETLKANFKTTLIDGRHQCGTFDEHHRQMLFGAKAIGSVAIGSLTRDGDGVGLLALGSRDPQHFRSGTDTLFLGHLAKVISQLLATL